MTAAAPTVSPGRLFGAWVLACALAESIGMTASAAAARVADPWGPTVVALGIVVLGGLIEGAALGVAQSRVLGRWNPRVRRGRWVIATVAVAGVGWAAASAASVLSDDDGGEAPALGVVLLLAAGLGLALGALLGIVQALVLRRAVRHPWRWVGISAVAWMPTMVIIFAGATLPDASWPTLAVVPWGTLTGLIAGLALGVVSGWAMPLLESSTLSGRIVAGVLRGPWASSLPGLALLKLRGSRSHRSFEFPVQVARQGNLVVIYPADSAHKTWWRNVVEPSNVEVVIGGQRLDGVGWVVKARSAEYWRAREIYRRRWPGVLIPEGAPLVTIELSPEGAPPPESGFTSSVQRGSVFRDDAGSVEVGREITQRT